jgi:acetyl esterase/lipase
MTFVFICIAVGLVSFWAGIVSKTAGPSRTKRYSVKWSEDIGTLKKDIAYGEGQANRFDLYLPEDHTKKNYGLVVYLHAGGFTSGDKNDDQKMLAWLCSKGYVAAGINYTLRTDAHPQASVYTQSMEIRSAVPAVIEEAEKAGYPIDRMAIAGGSAGHTLAMLYAYRDGKEAPVPVVLTFGAVGPSSFHAEDWKTLSVSKESEEGRKAGALLFSVMSGKKITPEEIKDDSYLIKMKDISAADHVSDNPVPSVVAYGACDKVQPFAASRRLETAFRENKVDYKYFVLPHSGHGLQNDDRISLEWFASIESCLDKYLPIE